MFKKKIFMITVFIMALVLVGCASDAPEYKDPYEAIRQSGEEWLVYGLESYEQGKEVEDFTGFFDSMEKLSYLTLYDHCFTYDKDAYTPIAESLFRFIHDKYGAEALLDKSKRTQYKTEYLKSMGSDLTYSQGDDVELFFSSMDFSSNETYPYIIKFDNVTFYFEDLNDSHISQYHSDMYFKTLGLRKMIEYLKENNLDKGLDTQRNFNFYMLNNGKDDSTTVFPSGDMYICTTEYALHEAVHALGIRDKNHIWLSEGLCGYLGRMLDFDYSLLVAYYTTLVRANEGYFDNGTERGELATLFHTKTYEAYLERGGIFDSADNFDMRIYYDVRATVRNKAFLGDTLGEKYERLNNKECDMIGTELNVYQASSMIAYLADVYGIDKVFDAYHSEDIVGVFGKDYEELKSEWLEYLE